VLGVSVDTSESHAAFAKKYHLPFPLLSDADGKVADSYGALRNLGLIKIAKRYTFLIDPDGKIARPTSRSTPRATRSRSSMI